MKRKITLVFLLLFVSMTCLVKAQSLKISGKVTDENGETLPGVSVKVKGTSNGTQTDLNGMYSVQAPKGATLVFSYLGYDSKEVTVADQLLINVSLKPNINNLNEVVVVGYGTQKVTKVSGAISTVKQADIQKLNPVRAEDAIQGRASGVTVISTGSPGAKPTVLIRGIPSYTGTDPVVVVDGSIQTLDDLNSIPASDIESINILKDAATTAIYGVKGGNGVILVTTKSGKKNGKTEFSYGGTYGQQEVMNTIGVLNASEYAGIVNEGSLASGGNIIFPDISTLGVGTNWQNQIFKKPVTQTHSLTARGGSDKMTYFVSAAYLGQGGIVGGGSKSYFNRSNGTVNLDFDLTPKLKFIANTSFVNIKGAGVPENSINSVISNALNFDPTVPIYNNIPNTYGLYSVSNNILSEIYNPLTQLADTHNESNTNKLYGKLELQYNILKNLKITSRYGYTNTDVTGKSFTPLSYYGAAHINSTLNADGTPKAGAHNSVYQYKTTYYNFTFEQFGNYNFKINEDHNFEAMLGFSIAKNTGNSINGSRQDVPFNSWDYADITAATGTAPNSGISLGDFRYETRNLSYFGRLNYDYKGKYLASFSMRRDGSSNFGANNKFGNFYAGSLGWVVSDEKFFKSDVINFLKIRGSYGITGNDNTQRQFQRISTAIYSYGLGQNAGYTFGDNPTSIGATVASYKNDNLKWERDKQLNAGLDIQLFDGLLNFSGDYFEKRTDGLLFYPSLSLYLGTAQVPSANVGNVKASGVDLNLGLTKSFSDNFKLNSSISFSKAKNLVTKTDVNGLQGGNFGIPSYNLTRFEQGYSPGYFYGYQTAGLFQNYTEIQSSPTQPNAQPGDIKFADINGDGVINDQDRTKIGDPFPKFTMGYNLGFSYKNFDFNTFWYASVGNDVYRAYERNLAMTNKFRGVLARWTGEGTTNDPRNPRFSFTDGNNNTRPSDRYVEDGTFLKIKDVQVGYTFPTSLLKSKVISRLRLFAQVKNAYTFTKYQGFDPEISGGILNSGIDRGAYPQARTFLFGLNMNF
ncbi:MAG: TonB-dependent receptor [Sphingobacteriales bacterium]|nr:TonB-dependent receptor [Sphingobacteriales bacterium]